METSIMLSDVLPKWHNKRQNVMENGILNSTETGFKTYSCNCRLFFIISQSIAFNINPLQFCASALGSSFLIHIFYCKLKVLLKKCSFVLEACNSSIFIKKGLTRNMDSLLFYPALGIAIYLFLLTVMSHFVPSTVMDYDVHGYLLCIFSS